jgi:Zn-dependent peptidase ImmA (M78 family)
VDSPDRVPVPIIEIVEMKLRIEPFPIQGLMEIDIDGFLTSDLKNICIDSEIYQNRRMESRLRFTYAHEVGHWVLHQKEIQACAFRNPIDWIHFREDFLEEDLNWFEYHAYEFAGRLLVPREKLVSEIDALRNKIRQYRSIIKDDVEGLVDAISRIICKKFQVSPAVIAKRIRIEKIPF